MNYRVGAASGATAGVLIVALLGLPQAATAEDTAPTTGPRVLTGTVLDEGGAPVAGAKIDVFALDRQDDGGDLQVLAHVALGRSNAHGGFVVAGKLQRQVKLNPDGSIPLEVRVTTRDDQTKLFNLDAVVPAEPGQDWTWGSQVDNDLVEGNQAAADAQVNKPVTKIVLNMKDSHYQPFDPGRAHAPKGKGAGDVSTQVTADPDGYVACRQRSWYNILWKYSGTNQDRLTPIQKIDTASHSKVDYDWSNTRQTKWQIAYTGVGPNYGGGLAFSNVQTDAAGLHGAVGNSFNGGWTINERFHQYRQYCTNSEWVDTQSELNTYGYWSGETKWLAHRWLGGHEPVENYDMYYCWDGAPPQRIGGSLWVARSTTSRIGGFFGVGGVQLDTSQENSSSYRLEYRPDAGSDYAKICGNNNAPISAKLVREVNY